MSGIIEFCEGTADTPYELHYISCCTGKKYVYTCSDIDVDESVIRIKGKISTKGELDMAIVNRFYDIAVSLDGITESICDGFIGYVKEHEGGSGLLVSYKKYLELKKEFEW